MKLIAKEGLSALVASGTECFNWTDEEYSPRGFDKVVEDLEAYIVSDGPFDAVMAFSSGAALAATLIIRKTQQNMWEQNLSPVFKCAFFFSGGIPGVLERDEVRAADPSREGTIIKIPTAHFWGSNDKEYPQFGHLLYELCVRDTRERYVHSGGHNVPDSKDMHDLENTLRVMRSVILKTLCSH